MCRGQVIINGSIQEMAIHPWKRIQKIESESKSRRVLTHIRVNYTHLSQALVAQMSHCDMDMTRK